MRNKTGVGRVLIGRRTGPDMIWLTHTEVGAAGPGVHPPVLGLPLTLPSLFSRCLDLTEAGQNRCRDTVMSQMKDTRKGLQNHLEVPSEGWEFRISKGSTRWEISVTVIKVTPFLPRGPGGLGKCGCFVCVCVRACVCVLTFNKMGSCSIYDFIINNLYCTDYYFVINTKPNVLWTFHVTLSSVSYAVQWVT